LSTTKHNTRYNKNQKFENLNRIFLIQNIKVAIIRYVWYY